MYRNRLLTALICCGAVQGIAAQAQEPSGGTPVLEEILVTAQKRQQDLQVVPISITAFSSAEIERAGVREFADYASKTPNVGFGQQGDRANTRVSIRGVTNIGGKANSVGIYEDEFNIAPNILITGQSRTADTSLYDVERIEVLRGPQGTFFGRNTMGGAISIITRKPDAGQRFGSLKLEADDLGGYFGRLSYNLPTGENSALSFTGYYREVGEYIDNSGPAGAGNEGDDKGARLAFRIEPNDALTIDFSYARSDVSQDLQSYIPSGELASIPASLVDVVNFWPFLWQPFPVPPIDTATFPEWPLPVTTVPFHPENTDRVATDLPYSSDSETDTVILNINWDLGGNRTLTSVTGWIGNDYSLFGDGDYSIYPAFTVGRDSETTAWSQELRLASYGNDGFDWMGGVIYSEDEITETDISSHLASDPYLDAWGATLFALAAQGGLIDFSDPTIQFLLVNGLVPSVFGPMSVGNFEDVDRANDTDSLAGFGDLTWHMHEELDLSFGLRYTDDSLTFTEVTRPTVTLPVGTDYQKVSFDDWSPRVNLNWFAGDDMLVYATVSKGYKVGGVNSDVTAALPAVEKFFGEETGWNYEIGFKSAFLGNRLQLNTAVFYFDWQDLQVRGQDVLSQRQFVQNATDATSKGLEVELTAAMTQNSKLRVGYGQLDSTFGYFPNAVDLNGDVFDASGNAIPFAPDNTLSAGLDVTIPLQTAFDGYLRVDYAYVDEQHTDAANTPSRLLPSFGLWDLRAGIENQHFDLALWVRNASDEEYVLGNQNLETYYGGFLRSVGPPRVWGATLTVFF